MLHGSKTEDRYTLPPPENELSAAESCFSIVCTAFARIAFCVETLFYMVTCDPYAVHCFPLAAFFKEGAMLSLWLAVICSAGTLGWAGSALGAVYALNVVVFVGLVGVWATLQFRSIYRDDPDMARFLER